jgi:uncharacterized protein (TIGR02466 family)
MTKLNENILFFNAVYDCQLDIDNKKLLDDLRKSNSSDRRQFDSGYQTPNTIGKQRLDWFFENIDPLAFAIAEKWGIKQPIKLLNWWYSIHKKYDYGKLHNHSEGIISGVYYIKVPSNSGQISFQRPDNQQYCFEGDVINEYNFKYYSYDPVQGQVLLFPSYLNHLVHQNITEDESDERICIAFNYAYDQ